MNQKIKSLISLCLIITIYSCKEEAKKKVNSNFNPKIDTIAGYELPADSVAQPIIIPVDESKLPITQLGTPTAIKTSNHIVPVGIFEKNPLGPVQVCTPGADTFLLPIVEASRDSTFQAGTPAEVLTKDPDIPEKNSYNFRIFGDQQGLWNESISDVIEDKLGNIWLQTFGVVYKFDGKTFWQFTGKSGLFLQGTSFINITQSGDIWMGSLSGRLLKYDGHKATVYKNLDSAFNDIESIQEDQKGNIWIASGRSGIYKFDGTNFTSYSTKQGLIANNVLSLKIDHNGNVWAGTGKGLSKFDGKSFTNYSGKSGLTDEAIRSLTIDSKNNVWLGNRSGVSKYDGNSFTTIYTLADPSFTVFDIYEDKKGYFWFAADSGVIKYDGVSYTKIDKHLGLPGTYTTGILQDKNGNMWFATNKGLAKSLGHNFKSYGESQGFNIPDLTSTGWGNGITVLTGDEKGILWIGTNESGLGKYDGNYFYVYTNKAGLTNNMIRTVFCDSKNNVWIAYEAGGIQKYDGNNLKSITLNDGLCSNNINKIFEDKDKNIWFASSDNGISKYDGITFTNYGKKQGLSGLDITSIAQDKEGNMWFGENGTEANWWKDKTLNKFDGKKITWFGHNQGLKNLGLDNLFVDSRGYLWLGGNGLTLYDGKTFTTFQGKDGLSNSNIRAISEDKNGDLLFPTRWAMTKLSKKHLESYIKNNHTLVEDVFFTTYFFIEGFPGKECAQYASFLDKNGSTWMYSGGDFIEVHSKENKALPNIQLIGINMYNEQISWTSLLKKQDSVITLDNGQEIKNYSFDNVSKWYGLPMNLNLSYKNNYMTFKFIGITQNYASRVKYKYKLDGYDENWSTISSRNEAPYVNILPGTYTFKVKAMNNEGHWSKEFNYTFTINPPWWQTTWFRAIEFIFLLILLYTLYRWRTSSLRKRQKELEHTVLERTAEIREKQQEITDSINYARRIQFSLLAHDELLQENLPEHFIYFQPKDIVSGDFYWATKAENPIEKENKFFYLAVCDSTGHGVPGAFMSLLNISYLNEAINEKNIFKPNEVLNHVRKRLTESMEGGKDGMDASLIRYEKNKITYSSANNKPVLVRNNELIELNADKMPVGKSEKESSFTEYTLELKTGDVIYFYTDGYADQFGGVKGKKFKYKNLNTLLVEIHKLSMEEQKIRLQTEHNNWRGDLEQVDDICIVGIRV